MIRPKVKYLVQIEKAADYGALQMRLSACGAEGWELVSTYISGENIVCIFKMITP